jgi:hypothetical protein
VSHKIYKIGDLVRLDPEKYNVFTAQALGVVTEIDDSEGWRTLQVTWVGDRDTTGHLPSDLNLVSK